MDVIPNSRLFWFLKDGATMDLDNPGMLDAYAQHILSAGSTKDVRSLLQTTDFDRFRQSFDRIKHFLRPEVRMFWEDFFGDH